MRILFYLSHFVVLGFFACGGNRNSGSGTSTPDAGLGTGSAATDAFTTFDTVAEVVVAPLNTNLSAEWSAPTLKGVSVSALHVHCTSGGPASVNGNITGTSSSGTFSLTAAFDNCNGVNGTLVFSGDYKTAGSNWDVTVTAFSGTVGGNGCLLTLDKASYEFTLSQSLITAPLAETLGNSLLGTCTEPGGSATLACQFGAGINALSPSAFTTACGCTGVGCGG